MVLDYAEQYWGMEYNPNNNTTTTTRSRPRWEIFWEQHDAILNRMCDQVQECKGATSLVQQLDIYDIPMCIATSSRMISVQQKSKHHPHLFRPMKHIVTGEMIARPKPYPDIYLEAAARLQEDPKHCLVIEDSIAGAKAGKAAGCWVVAVPDIRMKDKSPFMGIADEILSDLTEFDLGSWGLGMKQNTYN